MMANEQMSVIVDHFERPRNRGTMEEPHVDCEDVNPACGDRVRLQVRLSDADVIDEVRFVGDGCVVSMASASILTTLVAKKSLEEVVRLPESEVLDALHAPVSPRRLDCALLAHRTLRAALVRYYHERRIRH